VSANQCLVFVILLFSVDGFISRQDQKDSKPKGHRQSADTFT